MKFVIAIEPGDDDHAYGVVVPDLPGCFSAGDTLDEAFDNAKEAIELWCETVIEDGGQIPANKPLAAYQANAEYVGWVWAVVDAPIEKYFGPAEKINVTMPKLLLSRVDDYAKQHGLSRSGFLAQAARRAMQQ